MRSSDDLFRLIQGLTKNEKGYFKKYCTGNSGSKYILLFDAIARQDEYDEAAIKKKLKDPVLVKNFASEKNYLYHLVLESLVAANRAQRTRSDVELLLSKARILGERSFYNESLKLLHKVRLFCHEAEAYDLLLTALHEEWYIWSFCDRSKRRSSETISAERETALQQSGIVDRFRHCYSRIIELFRTIGIGRSDEQLEQFRAIYEEALELQQIHGGNIPVTAQLYATNTILYYHNVSGQLEQCYDYTQQLVRTFDAHPLIIESMQSSYISGLNNLILLQLYLGKLNEAEETIAKISTIRPFTIKDENSIFVCRYNSKLELLLRTSRFEEAFATTQQMQHDLVRYEDRIANRFTGHLHYWAFKACCYTEHRKEALWWLNRISTATPENPFPPEVVNMSRLSELTLHCDLQNDDLLESLLTSAKRYLDKKSALFEPEQALIQCLSEYLRDTASVTPFEKLYDTLNKFRNTVFEERLFTYFDFDLWARSRATGVPLQDIVKGKNTGKA
jgi:hypothetical protein